MTSPGGWYNSWLDGQVPERRSSLPGSSSGNRGTAPSNYTNPGLSGSADRMERQANHDPDWKRRRYGDPVSATGYGQTLWDVLDMPEGMGTGSANFLMDAALPGEPGAAQFSDANGHPVSGSNIVEYSVAGGVEWLRNTALKDKETYNSLVVELWKAGYLTESDIRLNAFTTPVAQAFAQAAWDVAAINANEDSGAVYTLWDHLNNIVSGFDESGFGPNASGSGGRQPLTRQDQRLSDEDLKAGIHDTARNLLGRKLTADEEKVIGSVYRSAEQAWNDKNWTAAQAERAGQASTVETSPLSNDNVVDSAIRDKFATEKGAQDLASYVGVMSNMMGLGMGGMTDLG